MKILHDQKQGSLARLLKPQRFDGVEREPTTLDRVERAPRRLVHGYVEQGQ